MRKAGAALCLLLVAGCGADRGPMRQATPPEGYAAAVLASRAEKDLEYATDPDSPIPAGMRSAFRGLQYWPVDPRYRLAGPLEVFEQRERFTLVTTMGEARPCERYGRLTFVLDGGELHLSVYRLLDGRQTGTVADLFVPFMDATTGKETYPAGRYVNLEDQGGGRYVLDFNLAYNPSCAYRRPSASGARARPRRTGSGGDPRRKRGWQAKGVRWIS